MHQFITLSCISNNIGGDLIGTTRWTGVSLKQLLPELGLLRNATHLKIRSLDSFYEVVALDTIRADDRVMLTYAWDGLPLSAEHGFPLRIYIPDRYGMKQPKWIESIEAIDRWEPGFWVVRGWDSEAHMKATSAIDTIATNMTIGQPNPQMRVPIGGFAHAGVRGISRVEIRADSGHGNTPSCGLHYLARPGLSGVTTGRYERASTHSRSGVSKRMARPRYNRKLRQTQRGKRPLYAVRDVLTRTCLQGSCQSTYVRLARQVFAKTDS